MSLADRTVAFGAGLMEQAITFADGSAAHVGGSGGDLVSGTDRPDGLYGGPGDDSLQGGAGDDLMQGNDRVQLDRGTTYAVSQSGADTVIDMAGGGRMALVGVQMSTLTGGWIFTL